MFCYKNVRRPIVLILCFIMLACAGCAQKESAESGAEAAANTERVIEIRPKDGTVNEEGAGTEGASSVTAGSSGSETEPGQPLAVTSGKIEIRQIDASDYPTMRLYMSVTDEQDQTLEDLPKSALYLNEKQTIDGEFTRLTVKDMVKLDQNEGLSVGLVADASGSMVEALEQAKAGMSRFLDTLQTDVGDEAEMTVFSSEAYTVGPFGTSIADLKTYIRDLYADGNTRLYDTLLNAIERVNSRNNAKCVVAFTDGIDNESYSTADDVIRLAQRYEIPVYLIGVGSEVDAELLGRISAETGGSYWPIDDVGELSSVYADVFRREKDSYCVTYETKCNAMASDAYLEIGFEGESYEIEGVRDYSYSPKDFFDDMYSRFLIAGIDCQTKGERNLLDSGLITTSEASYRKPECVAYQSQKAIEEGGVGTAVSGVFEVLVDHAVVDVSDNGDGSYTLWGTANYDISKTREFGKLKDVEKQGVTDLIGRPSDDEMIWLEENRTLYEHLTLVRDTDGKWKFDTRVYERQNGGDATVVNRVYRAYQV